MALLAVPAGPLLAQPAAPGGSTAAMPGAAAPGGTGAAPSAVPDTISPGGGMTGLRPMRGQPRQAVGMNHYTHKPPATVRSNAKRRGGRATPASATGNSMDAPRSGGYSAAAGDATPQEARPGIGVAAPGAARGS